MSFIYKATPTGQAFHDSDAFVKLIMGPFGSGKSTTAAEDMLIYSLLQPKAPDGVRYSRWGVVRASYPELTSSTRRTLLEVFPNGPGIGTINLSGAPLKGVLRIPLPDGSLAQVEFDLISAQDAQDERTFRSVNWTGCWINEATEVAPEILGFVTGRVPRFPPPQLGGCAWYGVLMDCNAPPPGHFLRDILNNPTVQLNGQDTQVAVFRQPPAAFKVERDGRVDYEVNPAAENLENITGGMNYYRNQIAMHLKLGRSDIVENYFCMLDTPVREGRPVFPQFEAKLHVASAPLEPTPHRPVIVGYDTSGVHPAAVMLQMVQGKWRVLDELLGEDLGLEAFVESALVPLLRQRYADCEVTIAVDPADAKDAYTALSPSTHLKRRGFRIYRPATNAPATRIRAVERLLNLHQGGLVISPTCAGLIRALSGGYRYRRLKISGSINAAYSNQPEKDAHSHLPDALQYAALCVQREDSARGGQDDPKVLNMRRLLRETFAVRRVIV